MQSTETQVSTNCLKRFANRFKLAVQRFLSPNLNILFQGQNIAEVNVDNNEKQIIIKINDIPSTSSQDEEVIKTLRNEKKKLEQNNIILTNNIKERDQTIHQLEDQVKSKDNEIESLKAQKSQNTGNQSMSEFLRIYCNEFIDTYTKISYEMHAKGESAQLRKLQKMILDKMKSLGIVSTEIKTGTEFDGLTMKISPFPSLNTSDKNQEAHVAKVLSPVFYYQPIDNSQEEPIMLKQAEVILYE